MKKALSIILAIVVILSCLTATAFAAGTKISESLAQVMEQTSDDEKIPVHVWLYSNVDKEAARRQARKECGYIGGLPLNMTLDEVYAYKVAYNRIVSEQEAAVANSFVEKLGIAEEDIVYLGKSPYVIANLTKAQINEAATYAEVESLSYVDAPVIEPADADTVNANLYEDKVKEIYPFLYDYSELYYHTDGSGNVDWVMITGNEESVFPEPLYQIIGNRVVIEEQYTAPFGFGYAVYDVQQNTVKAIYSEMLDQYKDLEEAFNEYGCGRLLGDIDGDNTISITDATVMQRCDVNLKDYPEDDAIGVSIDKLKYYSDFNRDGVRDIIDATCIQRYLAEMPYPIG